MTGADDRGPDTDRRWRRKTEGLMRKTALICRWFRVLQEYFTCSHIYTLFHVLGHFSQIFYLHFFLFLSSKCIVQVYCRACYRIGFPVSTNLLDHPLPAFSESFPSPPPSTTSGASGDLDFPHSEHRLHTLLQWTLMVIFWHLVISLHIEKSISPWNFPSAIHEDILSEQGLRRTTANPSFSRSAKTRTLL